MTKKSPKTKEVLLTADDTKAIAGFSKPRDPKRIKRIVALLGWLWVRKPDYRLGQIISICIPTGEDVFYVEDDVIESGLHSLLTPVVVRPRLVLTPDDVRAEAFQQFDAKTEKFTFLPVLYVCNKLTTINGANPLSTAAQALVVARKHRKLLLKTHGPKPRP